MLFKLPNTDQLINCVVAICSIIIVTQFVQARETYDDAISAGYTATLLEEDANASDIFRCLLGNLPAGAEATIKFAYIIELPVTPDGAVQFVLPTQLNPRYNPSLES
jgi:Vault protein inter-alpha-trypsin domain